MTQDTHLHLIKADQAADPVPTRCMAMAAALRCALTMAALGRAAAAPAAAAATALPNAHELQGVAVPDQRTSRVAHNGGVGGCKLLRVLLLRAALHVPHQPAGGHEADEAG